MRYRNFGSTGLKVSALGLGCMRLPTVPFIPQKVDDRKAIHLIRTAIDMGVNYLDTAWVYHLGGSERVLGLALQDGYRSKVHLTTKLFMMMFRKREEFDSYLEKQLVKLKTDHLDTYLFHGLNRNTFQKVKDLGLIEKMLRAKEQGKIRTIGFSFHDTLPVFKEIVDHFPWEVAQIQYNYMDTAIQATTEGLKYAAAKGMAIVIMEPLKGGQLANPPDGVKAIMKKAKNRRAPVDWALQFLWNLPEVATVISGMGDIRSLEENCACAERSGVNSLSTDDLATISELVETFRKDIVVPCTACQYCMPCPSGVNIPGNFSLLNNLAIEKSFIRRITLKAAYKRLARKRGHLNPGGTNGHAILCTECGVCVPKCTQSINIPVELKKVSSMLD